MAAVIKSQHHSRSVLRRQGRVTVSGELQNHQYGNVAIY